MTTVVAPGEERWIGARIGGKYTILGLVSVAHAMTHAHAALMPLIYVVVMKEFSFTYSELGLMVGITSLIGGVFQLAFGFISRRVLRKLLLGLGTIGLGASMVVTGATTAFWQLWLTILTSRLVTAPQHPVGNSIVADKFGKRLRGTALAVNFAGGNAGTILVPGVATVLIAVVGWRWTMALMAIPALIVGVVLIALLRERVGRAGTVMESGKIDTRREVFRILTSRNIAIVFIVSMVAAGGRGLGVVMLYVPQYLSAPLEKAGLALGPEFVGLMFTILMIGSVVGPLAAGRFSDILGRKLVLFIGYTGSTILTMALLQTGGNLWLLGVVLVLMGLVVYSESPVLQSLLADVTLSGSRDITFGIYFTFTHLAGSVWAWVLGSTVDSVGFQGAFYVMAASYVLGAIMVLFTRESRRAA